MNALARGFIWMALAAAIGCEENRPAPVATPPAGPPVPPVAAPVPATARGPVSGSITMQHEQRMAALAVCSDWISSRGCCSAEIGMTPRMRAPQLIHRFS